MFDDHDEQWRRIRYLVTECRKLHNTLDVQIVCSGVSCNTGDRVHRPYSNTKLCEPHWVGGGWGINAAEVYAVVGNIADTYRQELDAACLEWTAVSESHLGIEPHDLCQLFMEVVGPKTLYRDIAEEHEWKAAFKRE